MNSKLILNQGKKKTPIQVKNNKQIQIENTDAEIIIRINKDWARENTSFDVHQSLMLAMSPLFMNENKGKAKQVESIVSSGFKNIGVFIEQYPHYTGGRYSIYHQALLLSQFTKVTLYCNERPPFYNDFKDYYNSNFQLSIDKNFGLNAEVNEHDLVIGTPVMGGQYAQSYGEKFNIPVYLVLFESPNWISSMRDGEDANEHFWTGYKKALRKCDKILVPSYESQKHCQEWLNQDNIEVIYPCLNEAVAKRVKNSDVKVPKKDKGKYHILFMARMVQFKNPLSIIKKFKKKDYIFHTIGKIDDVNRQAIQKLNKEGLDIRVHGRVDDEKKFRIIKMCDLIIFPTKFEGFGMPPMEALYMNKPVVTYDLPVLKEIYGDHEGVIFVPTGDEKKFIQAMKDTLEKYLFESDRVKIHPPKFSGVRECASVLLDVLEIPKISTGTIIYNGEDYIQYSLQSLSSVVWESIIVDGCVNGYDDIHKNLSSDNTEKIMRAMKEKDILGKIKYHRVGRCKDKIELQNKIVSEITGKYYVKLDHDEIWKPEVLIEAIKLLEDNPTVTLVKMPFIHFWLSFNKIARDQNGKWGTKHPRIWRWNPEWRHRKSFNYFSESNNMRVGAPFHQEFEFKGEFIYHFGWVRLLNIMNQKMKYYKTRGIETYIRDTINSWKEDDDQTMPTQNVNSWAEDFTGTLPSIMLKHPYLPITDIRTLEDDMAKIILNQDKLSDEETSELLRKKVVKNPDKHKTTDLSKGITTENTAFVKGSAEVDDDELTEDDIE